MLKVLKLASIYFEITRKLIKFGSNSHIFVTVTIHDKMAFLTLRSFLCDLILLWTTVFARHLVTRFMKNSW